VRITKVLLGAVLLVALGLMWQYREPVLAAYQVDDEAAASIRFDGLDFELELAAVPPSPYQLVAAVDTRSVPGGVAAQPGLVEEQDPPAIKGGESTLSGFVRGPSGPVPGATVRIERDTSAGLASLDLRTNNTGRWAISSVLGGRYRLRAWSVEPEPLAMASSQVLFVDDDRSTTVDLTVAAIDPTPRATFTHLGDIYVGLHGTVAASITTRSVGADGRINVTGLAGAVVTLSPPAGMTAAPGRAATDANGVARFELRCNRIGSGTGIVQYENRRAFFAMPSCVAQPPPPTTTTTTTTPTPPPPPPPPPPTTPAPSPEPEDGSRGNPADGSSPQVTSPGGTNPSDPAPTSTPSTSAPVTLVPPTTAAPRPSRAPVQQNAPLEIFAAPEALGATVLEANDE